MDTTIKVDGIDYIFETSNNKTELKIKSESTPSKDKKPQAIKTPDVWVITRKNGVPLFALRPATGDKTFRIITAEQLYKEKFQWFEPLADSYRELIWVNPTSSVAGSDSYVAYRHFSWQKIIDFAIIDRWSISFNKGLPGDWKANDEGGAGYLMVFVDGRPYWTDGVGQIPFSVDTFKMYYKELGSKSEAIIKTIETGMQYGSGDVVGSTLDKTNEYDNFMVLRGALWASENHSLHKEIHKVTVRGFVHERTTTNVTYTQTSRSRLQNSISSEPLGKYGVWKK